MTTSFVIKYVAFMAGSLVFALLMNSLFLRFVKTLGIRNTSETVIRWSNESKPALGGITFFIVFLFSGAIYPIVFGSTTMIFSLQSIGIIAATTLGFLMGLADDAYNTRPILKSLTQFTCALLLIVTGTQINLFEFDIFNKTLTVLWVVGIMNSLNMLDNMDGITGSVALFICIAIIFISFTSPVPIVNLNFIIVSGTAIALLAFLTYNWHPAKMYMGDSGSQFLGIMLSAMGIIYFWNPMPGLTEPTSISRQLILPLIAFLVPIIDTTTVTINRLQKGKSPFIGGKDHTTHFLSRKGLGDKKVAYVIAALSLLSAIFVFWISNSIQIWNHFYTIFFAGYALLIFSILFYFTKQKTLSDLNESNRPD